MPPLIRLPGAGLTGSGAVACGLLLAMLLSVVRPAVSLAADPENCLSCHRYRGLSRLSDDGKAVQLYGLDPDYYDRHLGPHSRLKCTDCHERSEVAVIPHQTTTAVNCSRQCHLTDSRGMEVRFSHENPMDMLEDSVHTALVLDRSNQLLGQPLREDQSRCLLCHDEPLFRRSPVAWIAQAAPVNRCAVCHDERLPVDAPFAYWHVVSRGQPARRHRELVQMCSVCHSDPRVREQFKLSDTAASYLTSFHGRAMQLGSEETAGCLDCHVAALENVHLMRSRENPDSPTHTSQLSDTCRSPACHPTAGYKVSTAAVHMDLSQTGGAEYFIAAMFVVLILLTFGPSVLLQALELLQVIVNRHDPRQHQRTRLAERLMQTPQGRAALKRFTPHQRVQHWVLFASFTLLVITGFPLKFADREWAKWLVDLVGGLSWARLLHRYAGLALLLGMLYHLVYVLVFTIRQSRRSGKGFVNTFLDLPMVMRPSDIKHLFGLLGYLLFIRKERPRGARFSFEEKFEFFGVFWGTLILGVTGMLMWADAWTTAHLTGRVLTIAMIVHTFEAFLALLHVGIIHLVGVLLVPSVFPLSPAMFTGDTPPEEMAEAHAAMLEDVADRLGVQSEGGEI